MKDDFLLEARDIVKYFPVTGGHFSKAVGELKAVDGVSFNIKPGETMGFVGESGSGKSTLGKVLLRLLEPTGGKLVFCGEDVFGMTKQEFRRLRRDMQMVFQDPYASLNPRMTVRRLVEEPLELHNVCHMKEKEDRLKELLNAVGLSLKYAKNYPHMLSGGERQRVGLARALALNPKFIVLDEPVSALDVSIQSQIINLLEDLQAEFNLTYMLIAHNLSVVKHISDRVAVMYLGKIVEMGPVDSIFSFPAHPYTEALLSAIPILDPDTSRKRIVLQGDIPSPINIPEGCRFHTRCPYSMEICKTRVPESVEVAPGHVVSCHLRKSRD